VSERTDLSRHSRVYSRVRQKSKSSEFSIRSYFASICHLRKINQHFGWNTNENTSQGKLVQLLS